MALHHLLNRDHLRQCFMQVGSLLGASGRIYLADLLRPRRLQTVQFMKRITAQTQPKVFNDDYYHSMLAAFQKKDFEEMASQYLPACEVVSTFPLRLFVMIRTKPSPLCDTVRAEMTSIYSAQPEHVIKDLRDLRSFFRMGGLKQDPFDGIQP